MRKLIGSDTRYVWRELRQHGRAFERYLIAEDRSRPRDRLRIPVNPGERYLNSPTDRRRCRTAQQLPVRLTSR